MVSQVDTGCPVLGITLRPMDITLFAANKLIYSGHMPQGMIRVNEPGQPMRAIYRGGYDTLHLYIPKSVISECLEAGYDGTAAPVLPLAPHLPTPDPVIERLGYALLRADDFGSAFGQCYADSLGLAIVARLLGRNVAGSLSGSSSPVTGLPRWRLKRAVDYIEAHLAEPIGLADVAASTGLTRMHFAAQFRAATGLRPHEYLLRRRVERAQQLLTATRLPLVEVALDVGFKTQAHFTTVFARIVGETPNAWRRQSCADPRTGPIAEPADDPQPHARGITARRAILAPLPGQPFRSLP